MSSVLAQTQAGMEEAVKLLNALGTSAVYTPKSTGVPIDVKVVTRTLSTEELVGDYRQGDMRIEVDASKIPSIPMRYDVIAIDGINYTAVSPLGSPRRAGDIVYTYKFIVRGS